MDLLFSRILTGTTLGVHIVFATIGIGLPILITLAHYLGLKRQDPAYILLAKRWAKGYVILVAVGVVTGTTIGVQLNLLWPNFMEMAGELIALPFMLEAFAFFLEAIFLGIYLYTWHRFRNPWWHWACSLPVIIGSSLSGALITTVNAFMNAPSGFRIEGGQLVDVDPMAAIFNAATPSKIFHVLSSSYFTTACVMVALTAFFLLFRRKVQSAYFQKAMKLTMTVALVTGLLTAVAGDLSAKYMAAHNPEKLAAAEALYETTRGAPLLIGGIVDDETQTVSWKIELPKMLSFLSFGDVEAEVRGLNEFPADVRPPTSIHYLFQAMVGAGVYGLAVSALWLFLRWRKSRLADSKPLLFAAFLLGPIGVIGMESGWIFTEIGRSPWIIYGVMKMEDAVTSMTGIREYFYVFTVVYAVICTATCWILIRFFRRRPVEQDPHYVQLLDDRKGGLPL